MSAQPDDIAPGHDVIHLGGGECRRSAPGGVPGPEGAGSAGLRPVRGGYSLEWEDPAGEEIAALPAEALPPLAELVTLLEIAPWSGPPFDPDRPDVKRRGHAAVRRRPGSVRTACGGIQQPGHDQRVPFQARYPHGQRGLLPVCNPRRSRAATAAKCKV
jgi:hypothetical protein